jgi:hypothetical protein
MYTILYIVHCKSRVVVHTVQIERSHLISYNVAAIFPFSPSCAGCTVNHAIFHAIPVRFPSNHGLINHIDTKAKCRHLKMGL